jgi:hypothetical protein
VKYQATIFFLLIGILFFSSYSWGEDNVFTNEDLQKYQSKGKPTATAVPRETISYSELMRRNGKFLQPICTEEVKAQLKVSGGGCVEWRDREKPDIDKEASRNLENKPILRDDEEVMVSITGCPTLQEAFDGKKGNTDAVFAVMRHRRTIEEICATVGQGCKSCGEAPRQMGSNQRH